MKVQTNVSDDMVKKIDALANQMGVSRSALCSVAIGQYVMAFEKSMNVLDTMGNEAVKILKNTKQKD